MITMGIFNGSKAREGPIQEEKDELLAGPADNSVASITEES